MSGSLELADNLADVALVPAPRHLRALLGEIADGKRIRSANRDGSLARRGFRAAWAALAGGADPTLAMRATVAAAVAAARLGDLDATSLPALGLSADEAEAVLRRAFDEVAGNLDPDLAAELRGALSSALPTSAAPAFVRDLERQPRAGATCPGMPRLMLEPPEDHAEHCWAVAVFGVLLAPTYGADPTTVFLAGLAHHLHNAAMPDSGFTGEMLLAEHLEPVMRRATDRALAQLAPELRQRVVAARASLADDRTPEGRAFHAADVIDRVTQIMQHLKAASATIENVLGELALVHDGPVKPFHDRVLVEMGLP